MLFSCSFMLLVLFCSQGCAPREQAIDLYVDAIMLRELGENELAVERLNSAVERDKRFSVAYSLLGEIYQEMKDYEKSAASYEKATELNPLSFKDYFNLGRVYQIMKKFAQAVKAYVKACELEPPPSARDLYPKAHLYAAESYYELKDYDNALVYGRRAEQIDPNRAEVQKLLGDIYGSQKDYESAIRYYKRLLETDSNDPNAMMSLAVAYMNTNQYEPAKELLTEVTRIVPDNNAAYRYLGYCDVQLDAIDEAIASYNRAVEIDDKDWDAHRGLGVAYVLKALNTNDEALKAKAVEHWRLSLAINPNQHWRDRLIKLIRTYSQ